MTRAGGIRVERHDAVAVLQIDRPRQRNALDDETLRDLAETLTALDAEPGTRAIVVTGSDRVFASGADVNALLRRTPVDVYDGDRARWWRAVRDIGTPTVAAVSGLCLGAGCELALMSDVVIASESARFGLPETALGLIPGAGGTQMLPRAVGKAIAMDMVLTGRLLDAREAERHGLVSRVAGADVWRETAVEVAVAVAARPAVAQRLARQSVDTAFESALHAGLEAERRAFAMVFATEDAGEGLRAFVEKRDPAWRHR